MLELEESLVVHNILLYIRRKSRLTGILKYIVACLQRLNQEVLQVYKLQQTLVYRIHGPHNADLLFCYIILELVQYEYEERKIL